MKKVDVLEVIAELPPGIAAFGMEVRLDTDVVPPVEELAWEVAWYVREETERILALGPQPTIEMRGAVIQAKRCTVVPIVVGLGEPTPESVFETWLNHATDMTVLPTLEKQEVIVVHLVGDSRTIECSLAIPNRLREFAEEARMRIGSQRWTMEEYDAVKDGLQRVYKSPWDLWVTMKKKGG